MIPTLDLDAAVIMSDNAVSSDLKAALRAAATPLEQIPDKLKDWHPGSDGKVLNLVHPSLFPLVYGRSRILPSGVVGLRDCVNYIGKGEVTTTPDDSQIDVVEGFCHWELMASARFWSKDFQWLPCDVIFVGNGIQITSYINNLHPTLHADLYSVIEKIIAKAIPLWDLTLTSTFGERKARILHEYTDYYYSLETSPPEESREYWDVREFWQMTNRVLQRPEPRDFELY